MANRDFAAETERLRVYFARCGLAANDTADDLAQETLARELTSTRPGHVASTAWQYGIARRVLLEHLRRKARCEVAVNAAAVLDLEDVVEARRLLTKIVALSHNDRVALFQEHFPDLLTEDEIAEFEALNPNTRRSRVHRARKRLKAAA